jgi:integral membrane protein (TIGR01906 family)
MVNRLLALAVGLSIVWVWLTGVFLTVSCDASWFARQQRQDVQNTLPAERITAETNNIIGFLCQRQPLNPLFYTARETQHMDDVRDIFAAVRWSFGVASAIMIAGSILLYRRNRFFQLVRYTTRIAIGTICILGAIGLAAVINFESAFVVLHQLLFRNTFWLLDPASEFLVVVFPESIFTSLAYTLWINWIAGCAVLALICRSLARKQRV